MSKQATSHHPGTQTIARAIAILKCFTDAQPQLSLADIVQATKLNKATAYRMLAALEKEELIARHGDGEAYRLGPEAIALGGRALRATTLHGASHHELATLAQPAGDLERMLERPLARFTPHTLTTAAALRLQLAQVRRQGYATVCDELEIGYAAIAAPIFDHQGRAVAAICAGGPTVRLSPARLAELAIPIQQAATRSSARLGFREALEC